MGKKNKKGRIIFRSIILAILLVAVVYTLYINFTKDNSKIAIGDDAPDFHLDDVNDLNDLTGVTLSDYKGKGVMLNFWATYCDPCKAEMPYMQKLYPTYKKKGIEIIAVNLDHTKLVIKQFINQYHLTFPVVYDKKSMVMDKYHIEPIPTTFFIDPEGQIQDIVKGPLTLDKLEGHFQKIMPK